MYKVRLNTPSIQYWVKTYDRISEELVLTNITADAMIFNAFDIPFLEETMNETFEGKYIIEEAE
jgi:hypothetical protein|nr:MAG TPA: hypothetical protein [Caudoviricetes sp.]